MINIFSYSDYRIFLRERFPTQGKERGSRAKLARHLRVQPAFVSRVFAGVADLSFEQAVLVGEVCGFVQNETDYFFLLLQFSKAGSEKLKSYLKKRITEIQLQQKEVESKLMPSFRLTPEVQSVYYSSWHYALIHLMTLLPDRQNFKAICDATGISESRVNQVLDFLVKEGIVEKKGVSYLPKEKFLHIGRNTPWIRSHHQQWRFRALDAIDLMDDDDLFFSGPICLSQKDFKKVKDIFLAAIKQMDEILVPSPEETMACLNIDFFKLIENQT